MCCMNSRNRKDTLFGASNAQCTHESSLKLVKQLKVPIDQLYDDVNVI